MPSNSGEIVVMMHVLDMRLACVPVTRHHSLLNCFSLNNAVVWSTSNEYHKKGECQSYRWLWVFRRLLFLMGGFNRGPSVSLF